MFCVLVKIGREMPRGLLENKRMKEEEEEVPFQNNCLENEAGEKKEKETL